jgi:hypothetical protein
VLHHSVPKIQLLPVNWPPLDFRLSAVCRSTSDKVCDSSSVLGVVENAQYPLKFSGYLMPFVSYCYFRFSGRHCYFRLSANIDSIRDSTIEFAGSRKCVVAVEISFLYAIEAELHLFFAVFAWSDIYYRFCSRHFGILGGVWMKKIANGCKWCENSWISCVSFAFHDTLYSFRHPLLHNSVWMTAGSPAAIPRCIARPSFAYF